MVRRLRHAETKADRYVPTSKERSAIAAAHIMAEAMDDSCRGGDPQFGGNVADALYHIATALQRIADVVESQWGPKP